MIDENGDLVFSDAQGRELAFSRCAASNGAVIVFVAANNDGYEAYGTMTIEQLETALRFAKGEDLGSER